MDSDDIIARAEELLKRHSDSSQLMKRARGRSLRNARTKMGRIILFLALVTIGAVLFGLAIAPLGVTGVLATAVIGIAGTLLLSISRVTGGLRLQSCRQQTWRFSRFGLKNGWSINARRFRRQRSGWSMASGRGLKC
jgi:uncharacterized membrane protein